jgi:serine/threonine-protein kinase
MVGQHIAHYEILEKIGEGGMGVLYKARDHKLDRFVALKLLAGGSEPSAEAAQRFEQEAKAVSALEHPHIAAMHDRGEFDGKPYVVFEYLPGGSLREKLQRARETGRQLPLDDVLRYGVEIGAGLAHAHRKGVVHRDLKPENVLLTADGRAKVSDFGLALWGDAARITGAGKTLESAAYTSPEHSQQLPIDQRSDIFPFGVLLYELATGETPFRGEYAAAVVYDVVNTPTPSLRGIRPEAPEALDQILQKATAKEPDGRYRNMGELLEDLREVWNDPAPVRSARTTSRATGPGSPQRKPQGGSSRRSAAVAAALAAVVLLGALALYRSRHATEPGPAFSETSTAAAVSIAVLPFENLSRNPEEDYLADGITEELITSLAKIPSLRVIARTSVMRYRQGGKSVREIGEELKVTRVVEGSVLHAAGQIRVTAQLIDTATEDHLWAESYQRNLVDVLSLQQDIAAAIAEEVQTQLASRSPLPRSQTAPVNPAAYAAWIRGRILAYQWTPEGIEGGIASFQRAIELDPTYAPGHAGLAMAYGFKATLDLARPGELWPLARLAAERALELDPTLSGTYTVLGFVESSYDWNWSGAEQLYQRALELNPGSSDAHLGYAMTCLAPVGRLEDALAHMQKAVELDPLGPVVNMALGHLYLFRREDDKAIQQYRRTIELDPSFDEARINLGFAYLLRGRVEEAAAALPEMPGARPDREVYSHLLAGRRAEALDALDRLEQISRFRYVSAADLAVLNLLVGRKQQALDWLEQGFRDRSTDMMFLKVSPEFDSLRSEPRFQELLRKMNLG